MTTTLITALGIPVGDIELAIIMIIAAVVGYFVARSVSKKANRS
ncbi:hypothetical protein ACG98H_11195 [Corynebacterium sp. L4756]